MLVSAVSVGAETAPGIYAVSNDPPHLEKLSIALAEPKIGASGCASPLELAGFSPLGISWRQGGKGDRQLLVINRGSRKAVEIFSVTNVETVPALHWQDCVPLPAEVNPNSVASLPDGGILVTQNSDPRDKDSWAKTQRGEVTGRLYRWEAAAGWKAVPGTDLAGPNGVAASKDGCFAVVSGWANRRLIRAPLDCAAGRSSKTAAVSLSYMPDNLRWTDRDTVLATGQMTTPDALLACVKKTGPCPREVTVTEIDPADMSVVQEWHFDAGETLGLGTTAIQVGNEIWVSGILGRVIGRFTPAPSSAD